VKKGGLSFGDDDDGENGTSAATNRDVTPLQRASPALESEESTVVKKRLKPNTGVAFQPKAMTKSALLREQQLKEELRKEYSQIQDAVKQTEIIIPFSFFDGKMSNGGSCRLKKGDQIWLFLERARKVGADLADKGDRTKKDWARISVDDLMIVRGDLIVPHVSKFSISVLLSVYAKFCASITTSITS
jgi:protein FAM50